MSDSFDPYFKWLAIPPEEQPPNHYRLLGIAELTPDADVIENAANRQEAHVRNYISSEHGAAAKDLIKVITVARVCLLNPDQKAAYDAGLETQAAAQPTGPPKSPPAKPKVRTPSQPQEAAAPVAFTPTRRPTASRRPRKKPWWQPIALIVALIVIFTLLPWIVYTIFSREGAEVADDTGLRSTVEVELEEPVEPAPPPEPKQSSEDPIEDEPTSDGGSDGESDVPEIPPPPRPRPLPLPPDKSAKPIDLLAQIDPDRDAIGGRWSIQNNVLLTANGSGSRLQIPYVPPDEYDLTVVAKRTAGRDAIVIGLILGDRRAVVVIDGWGGSRSGLDRVDGRRPDNNETTYHGRAIANEIPMTITCAVRQNRITVHCAQQLLFDWQGDPQRLSPFKHWNVPDDDCLFLGSYNSVFEISKVSLTPVSGEGRLIDGNWKSRWPFPKHVLSVVDHVQQLNDSHDASQYAERVFEAEQDFRHAFGEVDGDGWSASPGKHTPRGPLMFGPYNKDAPPGGPYQATFRMMSGEASAQPIAVLDVYDPANDKAYTQREILSSEFDEPMKYQDIVTTFVCDPGASLEFRFWWKGNSYVRVDRVTLARAPLQPIGPWQVKFYRRPEGFRRMSISQSAWESITGAEPFAQRQATWLCYYWSGHLRATNWFALVATAQPELPAGKYELTALSDDGVRAYFDGQLVIDNWVNQPSRHRAAELDVRAGKHEIRIEYFQGSSIAQIQCWLRPLP